MKLGGTASSVDAATSASYLEKFKRAIEDSGVASLDQIYNADETGLLYRQRPSLAYLPRNMRNAKGHSSMKSKERITLMLCVSASGTNKVPVFVIGKYASPRCFKAPTSARRHGNSVYVGQANAWMDGATCKKWFTDSTVVNFVNK